MRINAADGNRGAGLLGVALLAAVLLGGGTGCEQRVVGVRNTWAGGQPQRVEVQRMRTEAEPDKGPLESIGDALFGWMRSDEEEEQARYIGTSLPLEERMGPMTESRSPNAQ